MALFSVVTQAMQIREWQNVSVDQFHAEIVPLNQPAVLRSQVAEWPAVKTARQSVGASVAYFKALDVGKPMYTIVGSPDIGRRFFYGEGLRGTNFQRTQATLTNVLDNLTGLERQANPHAIAVQAGAIREALPGFEKDNRLPLLDATVAPTLWIGNSAIVAPHYDVHDNVACVVTGRRHFTLFPPDQVANLYVGPTLDAPGGVPISTVDLANPDLEKFPRFADALEVAQEATLEPGDAIFIPTPWWHAVEALEAINVLVNYWWGGLNEGALSPNHSLLHAMLTIAKLSPSQRESWRHFFDYFVFRESADPAEHLPADLHDIARELTPEQRASVYQFLRDRLR